MEFERQNSGKGDILGGVTQSMNPTLRRPFSGFQLYKRETKEQGPRERESEMAAKTQKTSPGKIEGLIKTSQAWSVPHTAQWPSEESHLGNGGHIPARRVRQKQIYLTKPETKPEEDRSDQLKCSHYLNSNNPNASPTVSSQPFKAECEGNHEPTDETRRSGEERSHWQPHRSNQQRGGL